MNKNCCFSSLGHCCVDHLCQVDSIPVDLKIEALSHLTQGGGPSATAAVAASRLGMQSVFIGTIGDDPSGQIIQQEFRKDSVDISGLAIRKNCTSTTAFCWVDSAGRRSIVWYRGSGPELSADEVPESLVSNAAILHLDGHQLSAANRAVQIARRAGVLTAIDAGTLRPGVYELCQLCDIVIVSEKFAAALSGRNESESGLRKLSELNAAVVGITLGPRGSICFDRAAGKIFRCPAFPVDPVVDTTGAGDVYHAAFEVFYHETHDTPASMRFAAAAAGLKCRKTGGRTGIPARFEAEAVMNSITVEIL